jgi:ligand-binding sensor protein/two-component sensor histidine kinase
MEKIDLQELIDVNILQKIQDGFSAYTGMAALITDADGVPVTKGSGFTKFCKELVRKSEAGGRRCEACDRDGAFKALRSGEISVYQCHAGLTDYAAPIMVEDKVIGSFIGGQVRTSELDMVQMREKAWDMGIDPEVYVKTIQETNYLAWEDVEKAAVFLARITEALSAIAYHSYLAIQEYRKAERAARSQSDFVMNLSLHMKQNMEAWMEHAGDLVEQVDSPAADNMRTLLKQGTEVYSMVEDAVEYIKMSDGKVELSEDNYRIRTLLQEIVENVTSYYGNNDKQIMVQVDEKVPEFMLGDAGRIGQILSKLLFNCISSASGGELIIRANSRKASYAVMLSISVEDASMKLSSVQLDKVREYIKSGSVQEMEWEGRPELGFSIVSFLTRHMSGKFEVNEKPGGGTVFTISLPQLEVKGGMAHGI